MNYAKVKFGFWMDSLKDSITVVDELGVVEQYFDVGGNVEERLCEGKNFRELIME